MLSSESEFASEERELNEVIDTRMVLRKCEEIVERYEKELERYDLEQLTRKPGEEEWSLGQMYEHLIRSTLFMHLANVEACRLKQADGETAAEKTEAGKALFELGSFPPVKIRVPPSPQYTPPQPESKEALVDGLRQVLKRMRELEPILEAIPAEHTKPHPRFGAFNAPEWYAMVEMHFRHHLLQKERLDAFLASGAGSATLGDS